VNTCLEKQSGSVYFSYVIVIVLSATPLIAFGILNKNYKSLHLPSMNQKIGSFYLGLKTKSKWAAVAYSPIFLGRRLVFVIFTFALTSHPYLQVHLFIYMLLWYVIYIE